MPAGRRPALPVRGGQAVAVLTLLLASCGAKKSALRAALPTTSSSSATPSATAPPPPPTAPLTGLPPTSAAILNRPALVVKVDNVDGARPQAGLDQADLVYEEMVEGQLTRLIAVFQSNNTAQIGPVRSTRTTDIDVVSSLNRPLYAYSGGNKIFVRDLDAAPVVDVGAATYAQPYYFLSGPHVAPHNLYANAAQLYKLASAGSQPPPPAFEYRKSGQAPSDTGTAPATQLSINFGFETSAWNWAPATQTWNRSQDGTADVLQDGHQIAAANVIVQITPYLTDGYATGEGVYPPPPIPEGQTVGTGTATVFTDGMAIPAHWSKASPTAVTTYTDASGQPILLTPGPTWVELAPPSVPVSVK